MKPIINSKYIFTLVVLSLFLFHACTYKEVVDLSYPESKAYLPAAKYGIYKITDSSAIYQVPTTGKINRYYLTADKLVVPLAVYRSGIHKSGNFTTTVSINTAEVPEIVLPLSQITFPSTVTIPEGKDFAIFEIQVNKSYLSDNQDKTYFMSVTIDSDTELNTALIEVSPEVVKETK